MSSLERRATSAFLAEPSTSDAVGKGLMIGGGSTLAILGAAALLPFGVLFWAIVAIAAGVFLKLK